MRSVHCSVIAILFRKNKYIRAPFQPGADVDTRRPPSRGVLVPLIRKALYKKIFAAACVMFISERFSFYTSDRKELFSRP